MKRTEFNSRHKKLSDAQIVALRESSSMLKSYHNRYRARRCFIILNTLGLTKSDWCMLRSETTFCIDDAYRNFVENKVAPFFYICSDKSVFNFDPCVVSAIPCHNFYPLIASKKYQINKTAVFLK